MSVGSFATDRQKSENGSLPSQSPCHAFLRGFPVETISQIDQYGRRGETCLDRDITRKKESGKEGEIFKLHYPGIENSIIRRCRLNLALNLHFAPKESLLLIWTDWSEIDIGHKNWLMTPSPRENILACIAGLLQCTQHKPALEDCP